MRFTTTRFGQIEFPEDVVMRLPEGLPGFPQCRRFLMLEMGSESTPLRWLQSLERPELTFVVIDPQSICPQYRIDIDVDTARLIGTDQALACAILCIVMVPPEAPWRMTANLKAPLVINADNRIGRQIILGSNAYGVATRVLADFPRPEQPVFVECPIERESVVQHA